MAARAALCPACLQQVWPASAARARVLAARTRCLKASHQAPGVAGAAGPLHGPVPGEPAADLRPGAPPAPVRLQSRVSCAAARPDAHVWLGGSAGGARRSSRPHCGKLLSCHRTWGPDRSKWPDSRAPAQERLSCSCEQVCRGCLGSFSCLSVGYCRGLVCGQDARTAEQPSCQGKCMHKEPSRGLSQTPGAQLDGAAHELQAECRPTRKSDTTLI